LTAVGHTPVPAVPAVPTQAQPSAAQAAALPSPRHVPAVSDGATHRSGLPSELINLQQAADDAQLRLRLLDDTEERDRQRRMWFEAAAAAQAAVTQYARTRRFNRYEVEKLLRQAVRHPEM
jgi:hypothetical protein